MRQHAGLAGTGQGELPCEWIGPRVATLVVPLCSPCLLQGLRLYSGHSSKTVGLSLLVPTQSREALSTLREQKRSCHVKAQELIVPLVR